MKCPKQVTSTSWPSYSWKEKFLFIDSLLASRLLASYCFYLNESTVWSEKKSGCLLI